MKLIPHTDGQSKVILHNRVNMKRVSGSTNRKHCYVYLSKVLDRGSKVKVPQTSFPDMAEKTGSRVSARPMLRRQRERTQSVPEGKECEDLFSFPPETLRRHTLLSTEFQNRPNLKAAKDKKHDVFSTLQETLEVLRDEAEATSRDSHKRDDLWCHPFEIPEHPIGQSEMRREEINLERQQSRIMKAGSSTSLDEKMFSSKEGSQDQLPTFYQRLSISGGNTSGVSKIALRQINIFIA